MNDILSHKCIFFNLESKYSRIIMKNVFQQPGRVSLA